jgi:Synergist-CTERM protein sorting domain-containing protein
MKRFKILAFAIALVAVFAVSASADIFYTVYNSGAASTASVGTIAGGEYGVSKDLIVGLGGDVKAYSFKDHEGTEKVLIREYSYGRNDSVSIYTPGKWDKPDVNARIFGTNIYSVASSGQYLYTAGYESYKDEVMGAGQVIRVDMKNGYQRDKTYSPEVYVGSDGKKWFPAMVSVTAHEDNIYVVTAVHDETWASWEPGKVIEFDRDLNPTGKSALIGKNAGGMTEGVSLYNGKLYIGCSGGSLGTESFGDYWEVDLATMTSKKIIDLSQNDLLGEAYGGYGVTISADGTAFLMFLNYGADFNPIAKLFVTSVQEMLQGSVGKDASSFTGKTGYTWGTHYDEKTATLWCMAGTDLEARRKDGSLKKTFYPADLGDSIYSVTIIDSAGGGGSGGDSGGGCDAGFASLALLLACPAFLVSRKCLKN